ncbi:MAG: HAD family phosphatase [Cyanobacteria bacterium P01_C01_bin.89]
MPLKAVIFDFSGTIINDESIQMSLTDPLLLAENLRPTPGDFLQCCAGRSDADGIRSLFEIRGRMLTPEALKTLVDQRSQAYCNALSQLPRLPIYPGVEDWIYRLRVAKIPMAIVTGTSRAGVELVLRQGKLKDVFSVVVTGDDIERGKPDPQCYQQAIAQLQQITEDPTLGPGDCLAIEDRYTGIAAAKAAGLSVVGVANSHPYQMMQRHANWAVDYLNQLNLDRLVQFFAGTEKEFIRREASLNSLSSGG